MERGADFSGWGKKQGSKVKTWKKRFFVLRGRELVYYSGSGSGADEKGRLTVVGVDFAPDLKNGLLIRGEKKNKTQVLKMKTDTADESKAWLLTIRQAVAEVDPVGAHRSASFRSRSASSGSGISSGIGSGIRSSSMSSSSLSSSSMSATTTSNTINNASGFFGAITTLEPVPERQERAFESQRSMSAPSDAPSEYYRRGSSLSATPGEKRGWLLKEGRTVKSWKKRFFVLRGNVLTYYADETSSPKLGSLVVRDVETNFTTPFTLDVHAEGGRLLRIAADSLDDIELWDLALSQAASAAAASGGADKTRTKSLSTAASSVSSPTASSVDPFSAFEQHGKVQYRLEHETSSCLDDAFESSASYAEPDDAAQQQQQQWRRTASMSSSARPSCDGWLLKQGRRSKQWKRRFFTLTNDSLEYRHDPHDFPNEDELVVDVSFETLHDSRTTVAHIELDSGRTITVAGETPSEFARWADVLRALMGKPVDGNQELNDSNPDHDHDHKQKQWGVESHEVAPQTHAADDDQAPAMLEPEVKYGWLLKQGAMIKSWKRRYFVLEGDSLQYYEHIDKAPRGGGVVARVVRDSAGDRGLDVHLASGRILKVAAESAADLEEWYTALQNAAQLLPRNTPPATGSSISTSADAGDAAAPQLTKTLGQSGWLLKRGQNFKSWKLRFFVLERSRVLYYSSDDTAHSDALGSGVVFDATVGDARPLSIDVRFQNGRLLQLAAPDEEQFSTWLRALQTASNLTESFLSQHGDGSGDRVSGGAFDDEFDLDFGHDDDDDGDNKSDGSMDVDAALDWHAMSNQDERESADPKSGYATWDAAMANKPEFDSSRSSSSSNDDGDEDRSSSTAGDSTELLTPTHEQVAAASLLTGWLHKQGGTVKTWKRRYFSLHGTTLRYFKSESGSLLRAFTVARVDESLTLPLGLEVTTTTERKLVVTAESKDEYARWLAGLEAALRASQPPSSSSSPPMSPAQATRSVSPSARSKTPSAPSTPVGTATATVTATAAVAASVATIPAAVDRGRVSTVNAEGKTVTTYSGWLEKEGQRFKTWKRRYFTYKRGALLYFSDVGGVAHGHGVVTAVRVDESKALTLRIHLENDRVLRVSAASADDMDTWLRVLASDCPLLSPVRNAAQLLSPVAQLLSPVAQMLSPARSKAPAGDAAALAHAVASPAAAAAAPLSPVATSMNKPSAPASRGEARERVSDRLDPSDYLANDTISNESFLRIQDEQFRQHADSEAAVASNSFVAHRRSFKGDLSFAASDNTVVDSKDDGASSVSGSASDRAAKLQLATERAESEEDLAYYRELLAESEREREKREAEKNQGGTVTGCAACCIVM